LPNLTQQPEIIPVVNIPPSGNSRGNRRLPGGYLPTLGELGAVIRWYWPWRFLALLVFVLTVAVVGALTDAKLVSSLVGGFLLVVLAYVLGPRPR
jgi:hypothetical protein